MPIADEDAEQLLFSYVAGGDAIWHSCFRKQPDIFLLSYTNIYHITNSPLNPISFS